MRLPWLQIDADGMTRGEMLGRLLGVGPDAGIGLVLRLWRWALELSPDGDFSGGQHDPRALAAAIGWAPEQAEKLVGELVLVGLVEMPVGAGFTRIKGLGRYTRAWEKNNRRKPALSPPVTGKNPAEPAPEPARKTETETETEKKLQKPAGEKPPAPPKPPKPDKATADPRHTPLTASLAADYATIRLTKYKHQGPADAVALKALLAVATDQEIRSRWAKGLRASGWASCSTIAQLGSKWNDLAAPTPQPKGSVIHGQTAWTDADDFATALSGGAP